ncbi:hypothetical protein [Streptomyces albireticuli]|uniref:hypothetical protein n=1 Tax=Streptomyces albireticuli TaxID=1940 RepID=UPI0036A1ED36
MYVRLPGVDVPPHHRTASSYDVESRAASTSNSYVYLTGMVPLLLTGGGARTRGRVR